MPCLEWFDEQDAAYRDGVLPASVTRPGVGRGRASRSPGTGCVGDAGRCVEPGTLRRVRGLTRRCTGSSGSPWTPSSRRPTTACTPRAEPAEARSDGQTPMRGSSPPHGVSVWLDDLSRHRLASGSLAALVDARGDGGHHQPDHLRTGRYGAARTTRRRSPTSRRAGVSVEEAVRMITTYDVRWACDVLRPVLRRAPTAWTAGSRSRSTRGWPGTPRPPSRRPAGWPGWSTGPTC